ncbi:MULTISPECIES: Scr1 family TA system antitoxin-like transcriptional regulator [Glycomyces]|uniref:Scr1 family TA system antitoxin-like transcriptional regulator n=2 Tax=Glycomyces TaxID=58113 RepID=A0A9X3T073_9ACTN|nr:Scr1 family TA system antitoxin-like transcriptional regulator [Glycomyces lechevalierae]MDA1388246.1 Scr1 family TA system antitoxin-like transcriptional regulator [Glycomyces lechevalierae]MDR7337311.1 transcriptional regulator with XRE-family HTH domain [Glycomyces lechevalierae]
MAGTVLYQKFARAYLTAEVNTISQDAGWTPNKFARVMSKSSTTIRAWLDGSRIPDKGNLSLLCDQAEVEPDRKRFILHVSDQLLKNSELISDLDERNLYIVESGERTYPVHVKWNPLLISALLQVEPYHMKLLAGPLDAPADKVKWWKVKERRARRFFARFSGKNPPRAEFYIPSGAIADLDMLTDEEKSAQLARLKWVDSLPGCEVRVVRPPHFANYAFEAFESDQDSFAGPSFVYVDNLDQSRHVVDENKLALYDQARRFLRSNSQGIGRFLDGGVHQLAEEHPKQRLGSAQLR